MTMRHITPADECAEFSCTRKSVSFGLCDAHYRQAKKGEELRPLKPWHKVLPGTICSFQECNRPQRGKGLCAAHGLQDWHGKELTPIINLRCPNHVVRHKNYAEIVLTNRKGIERARTQIDLECIAKVHPLRWHLCKKSGGSYVVSGVGPNRVYMHRFLTNCPDGLEPDHRDGDGLNNRLYNLTVATHAQNCQNTARSDHRNVAYDIRRGSWSVRVMVDGVRHWGGYFPTKTAALARALEMRKALFTHANEERHHT